MTRIWVCLLLLIQVASRRCLFYLWSQGWVGCSSIMIMTILTRNHGGFALAGDYCISKAAVRSLTQTAGKERV
jgi:hypothetical protein